MPAAIPFIAAYYAVGAGVTAAVAAGGLTLASGLMIAGGALSFAGAASGNQKLSRLGAVAMLGGGIASLAGSSANAASAADAVRMSDEVYAGANTAPLAETPVTAAAPATGSAAADAAQAAELADAAQAARLADAPAPASSTALADAPAVTPQAGLVDSAAAQNVPLGSQSAIVENPYFPQNGWGQDTLSNVTAGAGAGPSGPGMIEQFSQWMRANPEATKVGGGLVKGAMEYYGQQQFADDQMKRQQSYMDWVRQRYSDSVRNLTIPALVRNQGVVNGARG